MPRKERWTNCVILGCLNRPGLIWRFFRRYYFHRLNRRIEHLPEAVKKLGNRPDPHKPFIVR